MNRKNCKRKKKGTNTGDAETPGAQSSLWGSSISSRGLEYMQTPSPSQLPALKCFKQLQG